MASVRSIARIYDQQNEPDRLETMTIESEELGERIDIVRYDEDPQTLIRNALKPAEVEEVILCQMLGRAIVLVAEVLRESRQ